MLTLPKMLDREQTREAVKCAAMLILGVPGVVLVFGPPCVLAFWLGVQAMKLVAVLGGMLPW